MKHVNLPDLPPWLAGSAMSFLPATILGGLLAMVIALLVGLSLMRLTGPYVAVATLGFLVIVQVVLVNWDQMTRGARTFSGVPALHDALVGVGLGSRRSVRRSRGWCSRRMAGA